MPHHEISAVQLLANQINALKSTGPRTEEGRNIAKFNARRHGLTGQFYCMSENDEKAYTAFEAAMLPSLKPLGAYELQLAISITQDQWRLNRSRAVEFNLYGKGHDRHAPGTDAPSPNTQTASTMAETYREDDRHFANIALYETRIHRMIAKNEKRLVELRAEREAAEQLALEEAELLIRLADFAGETPGKLGLTPATAQEPGKVRVEKLGLIPATAEESDQVRVEKLGLIPTTAEEPDQIQVNGFVFSTAAIRSRILRHDNLKTARQCAQRGWDPARIDLRNLPHAA